jgi:transposase
MRPQDASALAAFLTVPRSIREIARHFKVTKVTASIWVRMFPTKTGERRESKRGPHSKTFEINRSEGNT